MRHIMAALFNMIAVFCAMLLFESILRGGQYLERAPSTPDKIFMAFAAFVAFFVASAMSDNWRNP